MPEDQRTVIARKALKRPGRSLSKDQWLERYEEALNAILASLPQARAVGDEEAEKVARELFERHHVYPGYNDETRERLYKSQRASLIDQVRLVASALATLPPAPGWRGMDDESLNRLRNLSEGATAGPWMVSGVRVKWRTAYHDMMMDSHAVGPDDNKGAPVLVPYSPQNHAEDFANAKLVAAAVNIVREWLAALPSSPSPSEEVG